MKHLKALLCILLSVSLVTGCLCADGLAVVARGEERKFDIGVNPESVTAVLSESGLLTISGSGEIKDFTKETAPFAGLGVKELKIGADIKSIGNYTFYNCGGITNVITLPKGLIRIGKKAFSGDSLDSAAKPVFVDNPFTEVTVTRKREDTAGTATAAPSVTPAPTAEPTAAPSPSDTPQPTEMPSVSPTVEESGGAQSEAPQPEPGTNSEIISEPEQIESAEPEVSSSVEASPEYEIQAVLETDIQTLNASAPEEANLVSSAVEVVSVPDPTPEPTPEATPKPEATFAPVDETPADAAVPSSTPAAEESKYLIETIMQQEIGTEIFYPRADAPVFVCSADNTTFRDAMQAVGYREAEATISAVFDCGEGSCESGSTVVKTVPVIGGNVILPGAPQEFSAPTGGSLFSYSFGGWTESQDSAGAVRAAGTLFAVNDRTDLYFIANWDREILAKIAVKRDGADLVLSVPSVDGYEISAFRWQTCLMPTGVAAVPDEQNAEWTDISGQTARVYRQAIAVESGTRFYRCIVTVKKQTNLLSALFAAESSEELILAAVSAEEAVTKVTLTAPKNEKGGKRTITQRITVPVSQIGTIYRITSAAITGDINLVMPKKIATGVELPDFTSGQSADDTFVLSIKTGTSGWAGAATETAAEAYVLSSLPAGQTDWNSGTAGIWRYSGSDPVTAATEAEIEFSLMYDSSYESFVGGQVELLLQEYLQGDSSGVSQNTVAVRLTLDGERTGVQQSAAVAAGRCFSDTMAMKTAEITIQSAISAGFATEYQPIVAGAQQSYLSLYRSNGQEASSCNFPSGTKIVMADMTVSGAYKYYFYTTGGRESQIALSSFSGYSGHTSTAMRINEKLLFVVDFSHATDTGLIPGNYYLTLTHQTEKPAEWAKAEFQVSTIADSSCSLDFTPENTEGVVWNIKTGAYASQIDTRYTNGATVQITLINSEYDLVALPENAIITVSSGTVVRVSDGTAMLMIPSNTECTLAMNFSAVDEAELPRGDYTIRAEMRPMAGLQSSGGTEVHGMVEIGGFKLTSVNVSGEQRSLSLKLNADSQRLIDAAESSAELKLDVSCSGVQTDDTLNVEIMQKTGDSPAESSYTAAEGDWNISYGSEKAETQTITVTIPKGQAAGTYRVKASIKSVGGGTAAEEVYNFIVKGESSQ